MTSPPQVPVKVPNRRVVMGQITEVEESYAREVGVPPLILLLIALITISLQSVRAALANPIKSLRSE